MERKSNWFLSLALPGVLVPLVMALALSSASDSVRAGLDAATRAAAVEQTVALVPSSPAVSVKVPEVLEVEVPESTVPEVEVREVEVPEVEVPEVSKMAVCLAAEYALNPEWDPTFCDKMQDDTDVANPRKARCLRQRAPLQEFAKTLCKTIVEETTRENLDLLLPPAIIERETSGGRVSYNQSMKIFQVETDVCEWFLSAHRIVSRAPGTRAGTEILVWTYGDEQLTNRQAVRITEEKTQGLRINTCVAGEEGIMQTIPREWRNGTVIEATGEVLRGTMDARRARVESDPVLQVRLGCQALAEHRDLFPESERSSWIQTIGSYNTGSTTRGEHWCSYQRKILKHYLDACTGFIPDPNGGIPQVLSDVWPGCAEAQRAYDTWAFCERYRPRDE